VIVRDETNKPVTGVGMTFRGKKTVSGTTDNEGRFKMPLPLDENIASGDQFTIPDYQIQRLTAAQNNEYILTAEKIKPVVPVVTLQDPVAEKQSGSSAKEYFRNFDLSKLDSIQSLTVFYSIFKNYQIKELDPAVKQKVDDKFNELVKQLEDSARISSASIFKRITDSTFVEDDIKTLIQQARDEGRTLTDQRVEFDDKIRMINSKLEAGISNLDEETRAQLLSDLSLLEQLLIENEARFFKNQSDYRQLINAIKEKYFNLEQLENKLSESELKRLEEQRIFRQRLFAIAAVVIVFGILILLLIRISYALRKQKKELARANAEVQRMNENLEGLVQERTRMLEEANQELDTFLYRASHDMRSPVRSIMGLCNIARLLTQGEPKELISRVSSTTEGMDKLLKKLSLISEINKPSGFSSIALGETLENIREALSGLITENRISFELNCPRDLVISSYPNLVRTILSNVLENALFYSSLEGVRKPEVRVNAYQKDDEVIIDVYDNGVGIDPSIKDRLFDMFFKGTERSKGHGLGLYIVNKAIHVVDGSVEVESNPGEFTRFRIVLPVNPTIESARVEENSAIAV
jgi:signal transduction histidine kinase